MSAQHTPGPWAVEVLKDSAITVGHARPSGGLDTIIFYEDTQHYKPEALARSHADFTLASAAPELLGALRNALATLQAVYQLVDNVNDAGGATCVSGVAACNTMLKSLNSQRARLDKLVMDPGNAAIAKATTPLLMGEGDE